MDIGDIKRGVWCHGASCAYSDWEGVALILLLSYFSWILFQHLTTKANLLEPAYMKYYRTIK